MARRRIPSLLILFLLASTLTASPASATSCAGESPDAFTLTGTLAELEHVDLSDGDDDDCSRSTPVLALAEDQSVDDADTPPSTARRIVIGGAGLLFGVFLAVQQARSRLQTKDPDVL